VSCEPRKIKVLVIPLERLRVYAKQNLKVREFRVLVPVCVTVTTYSEASCKQPRAFIKNVPG
jgi:hypothetical protein